MGGPYSTYGTVKKFVHIFNLETRNHDIFRSLSVDCRIILQ
jgi:hypothetical protein